MADDRAGAFNRRLTIQQRSNSIGSYGEQAITWSDIATVWCAVQPLYGRELTAAQQVNVEVSHMLTIRYQTRWKDPKVMATYRGSYDGRIFNFHASYAPEESRFYVVILASEGLNQG